MPVNGLRVFHLPALCVVLRPLYLRALNERLVLWLPRLGLQIQNEALRVHLVLAGPADRPILAEEITALEIKPIQQPPRTLPSLILADAAPVGKERLRQRHVPTYQLPYTRPFNKP